jgi:hypothetical protein
MSRCLARRYGGPEGEADIVVDVFEMPSADDAFGVFTHDRDGEPANLGVDSLIRYGWLSFWKGRYFVSIYAEGESDSSKDTVLTLGRALDAAIAEEGETPVMVGRLPSAGLDDRSVRFLRSHQILNSHLFVGEDNVFDLGPDTAAVLGRYQRGDTSAHLLLVEYPDARRQAKAVRAFSRQFLAGSTTGEPVRYEDDRWYGVALSDGLLIAVLAADDAGLAAQLLAEVDGGGAA